jgi:2-dehydro-3-deoxyphosphooctonate aldolase (KDO 8-P synthase)
LSANISAAPVVAAGPVKFGNDLPISIIAGPCQLESRAHALEVASALKEIAARLRIGLVYKTSFDKANRTSVSAARGLGLQQSLPIFAEIRSSLGLPVLTDVHEAAQCAEVAQAVDVLQIPAFLCRQTDLLLAAAATGKVVNVKKGQFLAPWDMANVGVFIETHPDPDRAPSDGPNMVPLREFEGLLKKLMAFDALAKNLKNE